MVKLPEVGGSAIGLKPTARDLKPAVARQISQNSNQLLQLEAKTLSKIFETNSSFHLK